MSRTKNLSEQTVFNNVLNESDTTILLADLILQFDGVLLHILEDVIEWEGIGYSGPLREVRYAGGGGEPAEGASLDGIEPLNPLWAHVAVEQAQEDERWTPEHQAVYDSFIERKTQALLESWND